LNVTAYRVPIKLYGGGTVYFSDNCYVSAAENETGSQNLAIGTNAVYETITCN